MPDPSLEERQAEMRQRMKEKKTARRGPQQAVIIDEPDVESISDEKLQNLKLNLMGASSFDGASSTEWFGVSLRPRLPNALEYPTLLLPRPAEIRAFRSLVLVIGPRLQPANRFRFQNCPSMIEIP
jgi:hypothetical protein